MTDTVAEARAEVEPPIEVTPTTLPDQVFTLIRQITLILGGFATLLALLQTKDIAGIIEFLKTSDFIGAVTGAVTLAVLIYGNLRTRWQKQKLIVSAASADNSVAFVTPK